MCSGSEGLTWGKLQRGGLVCSLAGRIVRRVVLRGIDRGGAPRCGSDCQSLSLLLVRARVARMAMTTRRGFSRGVR